MLYVYCCFFSSNYKIAILRKSEVGLILALKIGLRRHGTPHYGSFSDFITAVLDKEVTVSYIEIFLILLFILSSW